MTNQPHFLPRLAGVLCIALLVAGGGSATSAEKGQPRLKPRQAAQKSDLSIAAPETPVERIVIKLQEGSRIRLRDARLTVLPRSPRDRYDLAVGGLNGARVLDDVIALQALLESDSRVKGLRRLFTGLSED